MNAYLSLSSPLSDERRSLSRYLGPRESNSFATVVIATGLGLFLTLVCILTFLPSPVAILCLQPYCHAQFFRNDFSFFRAKMRQGQTLKAFRGLKNISVLHQPTPIDIITSVFSPRQMLRKFMNY